jgi:hypothetical protein
MAKRGQKKTMNITAEDITDIIEGVQVAPKQEPSVTMEELGIDDVALESVLAAVSSPKNQTQQQVQEGDLRGIATFKKYQPKSFRQLAESPDGKIAVTVEIRDWEISRGRAARSGTSTKLHIRTKYIDRNGDLVYGFDLASFPADNKDELKMIVGLMDGAIRSL